MTALAYTNRERSDVPSRISVSKAASVSYFADRHLHHRDHPEKKAVAPPEKSVWSCRCDGPTSLHESVGDR